MSFHIDTNRINARGSLPEMNLLENWESNGVITIDMSQVAFNEARDGNSESRTNKTLKHIYTHTHAHTSEEQRTLRRIQEIIFPEGIKNINQANDVEIIFNADKYGCILITNDGASKKQRGGILGNSDKLMKILGIKVMNSNDAVEIVKECIRVRDEQCKIISNEFNEDLPNWVGQD